MEQLKEKCFKAPAYVPARAVLAIVAFLGTVFNYALRVSINLAMVAMVNHTAIPHVNETMRALECPPDPDELTGADAALLANVNVTVIKHKDAEGPFVWDEGIQQLVISSFFWGYALTQVVGGRLSEKFGVKIVMLVAMSTTAFCSMLIPLAAHMHFSAVIVLRVIMGILEGPTFPSVSVLISRWAPPWERSRMFTYIKIGGMVGTMTVFPASGLLIDAWGWESVFYFFGVLTLLWLVAWWYLVFDSPDCHPRISRKERDYIVSSLSEVPAVRADLPVPWAKMLMCPRMWVATLCAISHGWGSSVLLSLLPTYLKIMMGFNIKANGFLSAVPYLGRVIVAVGFSIFVDWLMKKKGVHPTPIRKAAIAISGYGAAFGLLAVSFIRCQILTPIIFLTLAVATTGAGFSGNAPYLVELAPNYAGTTYGILNTGYALTSVIGPLISGFIIKGEQTIAKWALVFRIAAGFYITTATLFVVVARAEIQPWNYPPGHAHHQKDDQKEDSQSDDDDDLEHGRRSRNSHQGNSDEAMDNPTFVDDEEDNHELAIPFDHANGLRRSGKAGLEDSDDDRAIHGENTIEGVVNVHRRDGSSRSKTSGNGQANRPNQHQSEVSHESIL